MNHCGREGASEAAREQDVVLEDMRQLVADEVVQLLVRQIDRQHHPEIVGGGEGADSLRDEVRDDVGLQKIGVRLVDDERRRLLNLIVEVLRQAVVGTFRKGQDLLQERLLLRVVPDIEVGRVINVPVEFPIAHFVLAEAVVVLRNRSAPEPEAYRNQGG